MRHTRFTATDRARLALELTMRDALDGMEELASLDAYWFDAGLLEILSIEPPPPATARPAPPPTSDSHANVLTFREKRRHTG